MPPPLTKQDHLKLIRFIQAYQKRHGYAPTVREVMRGLQLRSLCAAHYRLKRVEELGLVVRRIRSGRAIEVRELAVKQYVLET